MELARRTFSKRLYVLPAVQQALEAYAPFATLALHDEDAAWVVEASGVDSGFSPEMLMSELANYVLAQTIERKRERDRS